MLGDRLNKLGPVVIQNFSLPRDLFGKIYLLDEGVLPNRRQHLILCESSSAFLDEVKQCIEFFRREVDGKAVCGQRMLVRVEDKSFELIDNQCLPCRLQLV